MGVATVTIPVDKLRTLMENAELGEKIDGLIGEAVERFPTPGRPFESQLVEAERQSKLDAIMGRLIDRTEVVGLLISRAKEATDDATRDALIDVAEVLAPHLRGIRP